MITKETTFEDLEHLMKEAEYAYDKNKYIEKKEDWHVWYTKHDDWPVWYAKYIIQKIHEKN